MNPQQFPRPGTKQSRSTNKGAISLFVGVCSYAMYNVDQGNTIDIVDVAALLFATANAALCYGFLHLLLKLHSGEQESLNPFVRYRPFFFIIVGIAIQIAMVAAKPPDLSAMKVALVGTALPTAPYTATPLATPTLTPAPTNTPVPTPTPVPEEIVLLVANFDGDPVANTQPERLLQGEIEQAVQASDESRIHVQVDPTVLPASARQEAEALGARNGAHLVIWGESSGAATIVNFLTLRYTNMAAGEVHVANRMRNQLADPDPYTQFTSHDLAADASWLASFALAQSYYLDGDAWQAIDVLESALDADEGRLYQRGEKHAAQRLDQRPCARRRSTLCHARSDHSPRSLAQRS